jgi:hypothetical protein
MPALMMSLLSTAGPIEVPGPSRSSPPSAHISWLQGRRIVTQVVSA